MKETLLLLLFLLHERRQGFRLLVEPRDFLEQGLDHLVFLDVADRHPALEDDALARAGDDARAWFQNRDHSLGNS